ncbi:MAG: DNA primase [Clostridiales bacterium]|nr:DNA primase [Clostridiales bacterium]
MAFPEAWLNELMSKNDIASVISEYVQLTPKGGRLWGHCPFHVDKTPSFSVTPDKQLFHCFSCKAGGSVIQFIMQVENLSYIDAIRHLAQRAGMDMPNEIDDRRLMEQKRKRERIYEANREAALFFCRALYSNEGANARRYLEKRGVNFETAKKFGLGYSPEGYDTLFNYLTSKGFSREILIDAGLAVAGHKDPSKTFDFFRGRLMFPVISASGKVIAFGGRTMGNDEPKYINTGDTPVYNKRENIYAINLLKGKKLDDVIMVEGYMDVISLHQRGIDNAVASLGTALTTQQARLIKRYAPKVYYAYDGDEAGQKAMIRGIDILRASDIEARVIIIPDEHDPDEFIKQYGPDSFLSLKDASITGIRFKLERIAKLNGTDTPDGREKFAREACALLSKLDPVERDRYIPLVAERSGLSKDTVKEQCGLSKKAVTGEEQTAARYVGYKRPKTDSERLKAEKKLLSCIMASADYGNEIGKMKGFSLMLFSSPHLRAFCARLLTAYSAKGKADIPVMMAELEKDAADEVSGAYAGISDLVSPIASAEEIIFSLRKQNMKRELEELSAEIKELTSPEEKAEALNKYKAKYAEFQKLSAERQN